MTVFTVTQQLQSLILQVQEEIPPTVQERTHLLLEKMLASNLFDPDEQEKIQIWKAQFDSKWLNKLDKPEERENVSLALCSLLFDSIRPTLLNEEDGGKQLKLLAFENELKAILQVTVPGNQTAEEFITRYIELSDEQAMYQEMLDMISECSEVGLTNLRKMALVYDQKFVSRFQALMQKFFQLNENRKAMSQEVHTKLDAATKKVGDLVKSFMEDALLFEKVGNDMASVEQTLFGLADECLNEIKKI